MQADANIHQTDQETTHTDTPKSLDHKQTDANTVTNLDNHEKTILTVDNFFALLRSYLASYSAHLYVENP